MTCDWTVSRLTLHDDELRIVGVKPWSRLLVGSASQFTLDKDQLSNYRAASNLSLISKIIEGVVRSRLTEHLSCNNLLNPHQSAYRKHRSTETALFYIHGHFIYAIGSQKISCLCLLDLSAAFDTTSNILITRLSSWFGLHGTVLEWFKYYLSDGCFRVKCDNSFSSFYTCSCGVLKGSVLGPLFSSCILLHLAFLSISFLSLNRHLCADDTQLTFSSCPF